MENPFLIDIPDKDEYTFEEYKYIQYKLSQINIDDLLKSFYPPIHHFYEYNDFRNRCTNGLRQKMIDVQINSLPKKHLYKVGDGNNKNCIVCCTPFSHENTEYKNNYNKNSRYNASQDILTSLKEVGYNGFFYLFNGGFPNPTGTEMKYAGVPYCFKIFMMLEAKKKGFEKIIWIDSNCYAVNNPQKLFDILDSQETLLHVLDYGNNYNAMSFKHTIDLLNSITNSDIHSASYIGTIVFGLNVQSDIIMKIIDEYYDMVKLGFPFLSIFPEEIVLTSIFNKSEYKHLLYRNNDSSKLQIHEDRLDMNSARENGYYFLHRKYKESVMDECKILPLSFCIPDECIVNDIPEKECVLASLIPGNVSTYLFVGKEKEYNEMYRKSRFAITKMKGGWDCLRHYEILMNGCIPLFENLKDCPTYTLTTYPKHLNDEAYELYNNWCEKDEYIHKYNILCLKYLDHTRNFCTTSYTTKYFLDNIKNGHRVKNVLLLTCHTGVNYNRESLWIGLKRHLKKINGVAVEFEKMPFLYNDYEMKNDKDVNFFTYPKRLEKDEYYNMSENEIIDKIKENFWDLIIYGKIGPDEYCTFPHFDLVKSNYNKDNIVFLFGGDEIFDLTKTDKTEHHLNMFNRWIPYYPYAEYLNNYKQFGVCFVRELEM